jgi:hypothetical protein
MQQESLLVSALLSSTLRQLSANPHASAATVLPRQVLYDGYGHHQPSIAPRLEGRGASCLYHPGGANLSCKYATFKVTAVTTYPAI